MPITRETGRYNLPGVVDSRKIIHKSKDGQETQISKGIRTHSALVGIVRSIFGGGAFQIKDEHNKTRWLNTRSAEHFLAENKQFLPVSIQLNSELTTIFNNILHPAPAKPEPAPSPSPNTPAQPAATPVVPKPPEDSTQPSAPPIPAKPGPAPAPSSNTPTQPAATPVVPEPPKDSPQPSASPIPTKPEPAPSQSSNTPTQPAVTPVVPEPPKDSPQPSASPIPTKPESTHPLQDPDDLDLLSMTPEEAEELRRALDQSSLDQSPHEMQPEQQAQDDLNRALALSVEEQQRLEDDLERESAAYFEATLKSLEDSARDIDVDNDAEVQRILNETSQNNPQEGNLVLEPADLLTRYKPVLDANVPEADRWMEKAIENSPLRQTHDFVQVRGNGNCLLYALNAGIQHALANADDEIVKQLKDNFSKANRSEDIERPQEDAEFIPQETHNELAQPSSTSDMFEDIESRLNDFLTLRETIRGGKTVANVMNEDVINQTDGDFADIEKRGEKSSAFLRDFIAFIIAHPKDIEIMDLTASVELQALAVDYARDKEHVDLRGIDALAKALRLNITVYSFTEVDGGKTYVAYPDPDTEPLKDPVLSLDLLIFRDHYDLLVPKTTN